MELEIKDNFDIFIEEVYNLKVETIERYYGDGWYGKYSVKEFPDPRLFSGMFLSLEHYTLPKSNYEFDIRKIQEAAITVLLKMPPDQIQIQLVRLSQRIVRFQEFWIWYNEISNTPVKTKLRFIDIYPRLAYFFYVPKITDAIVVPDFIRDLKLIAKAKHDILKDFIIQINNYAPKDDKNKKPTSQLGIKSKIDPAKILNICNKLTELEHVHHEDKINLISALKNKSLPDGWSKIRWTGSRKSCFSFMMDLCGDEVEAQYINKFFLQYAVNKKTKQLNTNPLTSHDHTNVKRGFIDNLR